MPIEFVRFCYRRRRVGWPELYDEMCAVAGRGLFRGYDADDLAGIGIGFSLFDMPALAILAARIVAEEQALRRPVDGHDHSRTPRRSPSRDRGAVRSATPAAAAASRSNPTEPPSERALLRRSDPPGPAPSGA